MTDKEQFIPTLKKLNEKVQKDIPLNTSEKVYLSAMVSNQINVRYGYADIITYDNNIEMYDFEKKII